MRIVFVTYGGTYAGQTTLEETDAMAVPAGLIPMPYEYAPQSVKDAADAADAGSPAPEVESEVEL